MARRSRNDSVRNAHRVSADHVRSLCVVRRRARPHGLLDVRHGAISFAAIGREVNDSADALASPIERTRIRVLISALACRVHACGATSGGASRRRLRSKSEPSQNAPKNPYQTVGVTLIINR